MGPKKEESFIHHLLNETYSFIPETDSGKSSDDLYHYFNDRSQELLPKTPGTPFAQFLKELSLDFVSVSWREQTQCYRFQAFGHCFDLPSNWGPFENFNIETQGYLHIDTETDEHCILNIFSKLAGADVEVVFLISENHEMHLSFIESGKEKDLKDILQFAQKSFHRGQKKRSA